MRNFNTCVAESKTHCLGISNANVSKLSIKGQTVNAFGFMSHTDSSAATQLPLWGESSPGLQRNEQAGLGSPPLNFLKQAADQKPVGSSFLTLALVRGQLSSSEIIFLHKSFSTLITHSSIF